LEYSNIERKQEKRMNSLGSSREKICKY